MKLEKIKSNPTQAIMYGVLILFTVSMVVLVIGNSLSNRPTSIEMTLTATQELAFANQTAVQSAVGDSDRTASPNKGPSSTSPAAGAITPPNNQTSGTDVPTSISNQDVPAGVIPPPGLPSASSAQQTSTLSGPPSNSTPPSLSQTAPTEKGPPQNITPPPTLKNSPTEIRPPSGGTPPPTSQTTPTEIGPPAGGSPPPTPLPVGSGKYNDTNLVWQYSPGWTTYNGNGPYQSDFHYTETIGNYVDLIFTGTGFTLIYTTNTTRGLIDVYIDGSKVETIDANGALSWQSEWTSGTLTNTTHTARIVNASTDNNKKTIDVDAITILP